MDLGLSQLNAALQIGVCEASLINWELGHREPEIKHVPAIVAFIGFDPRSKPEGMTLGRKLVTYRQGFGWTQKRLAQELGIDHTTLARWERGERKPSGDYLRKVNAVLQA